MCVILGEVDTRATHVVNAPAFAPHLHIGTLRILPFTRPQPGFDLGSKLIMRDLSLSVKYGFQLEGDVVCQQRDSQVCGRPDRFLHGVNSLLSVCKKTNGLPAPHRPSRT
jgi:hypothetical protein